MRTRIETKYCILEAEGNFATLILKSTGEAFKRGDSVTSLQKSGKIITFQVKDSCAREIEPIALVKDDGPQEWVKVRLLKRHAEITNASKGSNQGSCYLYDGKTLQDLDKGKCSTLLSKFTASGIFSESFSKQLQSKKVTQPTLKKMLENMTYEDLIKNIKFEKVNKNLYKLKCPNNISMIITLGFSKDALKAMLKIAQPSLEVKSKGNYNKFTIYLYTDKWDEELKKLEHHFEYMYEGNEKYFGIKVTNYTKDEDPCIMITGEITGYTLPKEFIPHIERGIENYNISDWDVVFNNPHKESEARKLVEANKGLTSAEKLYKELKNYEWVGDAENGPPGSICEWGVDDDEMKDCIETFISGYINDKIIDTEIYYIEDNTRIKAVIVFEDTSDAVLYFFKTDDNWCFDTTDFGGTTYKKTPDKSNIDKKSMKEIILSTFADKNKVLVVKEAISKGALKKSFSIELKNDGIHITGQGKNYNIKALDKLKETLEQLKKLVAPSYSIIVNAEDTKYDILPYRSEVDYDEINRFINKLDQNRHDIRESKNKPSELEGIIYKMTDGYMVRIKQDSQKEFKDLTLLESYILMDASSKPSTLWVTKSKGNIIEIEITEKANKDIKRTDKQGDFIIAVYCEGTKEGYLDELDDIEKDKEYAFVYHSLGEAEDHIEDLKQEDYANGKDGLTYKIKELRD